MPKRRSGQQKSLSLPFWEAQRPEAEMQPVKESEPAFLEGSASQRGETASKRV
ncbi:hypothetical protein [Paenibacillus ferrarius]|uniref:hypothetical protein n=1 Tax=Paenibacillus ferrarius TaxID=1469647 RepID=UPI001301CED3|nr:hypothetical protein [Paenibacillus ferrarius]